jgi:hypothetical protein
MFISALASTLITRPHARRRTAASRRENQIGDVMFIVNETAQSPTSHRPVGRSIAALVAFLAPLLVSFVALVGFTTTAALACACGCSVFDVGGIDLPQEQDHGGNVFLEYWSQDQTQNYVGSSRASSALNTDKEINTQWINVGFSYMFDRNWGVMVRIPTTNRDLTTTTNLAFPGSLNTFNTKDIGDIEIMGMYTGFFKDMSTGLIFGLKLPSGTFTAPGLDRDTQIGTGSTDLLLGAFHRGLLTGDNAWQYFAQIMGRQPFLYQNAADPQGFFDGNPGVVQSYHPGLQIDGAAGIVYNNWYHVLGFDKITPLGQVIISHRNPDSGTGADPYNSGFDRVMVSPGVEFTKVLDEANNRVAKVYFDVEVPIYYRANAGENTCAGTPTVGPNCTEGQLVAPYAIKMVASYNF